MSYLMQHATRRPTSMGRRGGARVDERTLLNLPGFYAEASVRVFVENTSGRRFRRRPPSPRLRLRIADCVNEIALEFDVTSAPLRKNSLHKIDTLLGALQRFREALADEAALYAEREHTRANRRKEARCRT
jgi:hypothetical protein